MAIPKMLKALSFCGCPMAFIFHIGILLLAATPGVFEAAAVTGRPPGDSAPAAAVVEVYEDESLNLLQVSTIVRRRAGLTGKDSPGTSEQVRQDATQEGGEVAEVSSGAKRAAAAARWRARGAALLSLISSISSRLRQACPFCSHDAEGISLIFAGGVGFCVLIAILSVSWLLRFPRSTSAEKSFDMYGEGEPNSNVDEMSPSPVLCPSLVVPDGTRLACVVRRRICNAKQNEIFDILGLPARGSAPLFRVCVAERQANPGIFIETLGGVEKLAFMSTEELWRGTPAPNFRIDRQDGTNFGTIQKKRNGSFVALRGRTSLLVLSGDLAAPSGIQVSDATGYVVASTREATTESYQVHCQAGADVALILFGLLAIDKSERPAGDL
eukprot:gnl/TRDRNA2_/TRDRNA2_151354_c0_seq1.p1 gnl/TRDRNA2_/TRDRNA2_151354_c0~~gnl/TRDRNA2_/TRDRNA2_151354_c0_seq1.p1  ORF type:complete len:384 (+),score=63.39 gnl/TRDRNA2_/TRDRNA2_151354_c0_seq1:351-1502(+)